MQAGPAALRVALRTFTHPTNLLRKPAVSVSRSVFSSVQNVVSHRCLSNQATAKWQELQNSHNDLVASISTAVKSFRDRKEKFRIYHGSTNSTRPRKDSHKSQNVVDTSRLNRVLYVNKDRKIALVEPNVPMDRLIEETLKYNLIPPVVMEFPGITVGGGYAGTSGESSSFRYGFFDRTINEVEMVLANGRIVKCSDNDNQDLFRGAAGALGTLGITTMVELQLKEAQKYVEARYHTVSSVDEGMAVMKKLMQDPNIDYLDGILFSKSHGAIISGRMTDTLSATDISIQKFSRPSDPWFYLHVQERTSQRSQTPVVEAIPLPEYLFRYDRGGFWVGRSAFDYFKFTPFNRLTRWFLDDFLHTRMMYTALHASGQSQRYVVQDLAMPFDAVEQFIEYTDRELNIWPLWLCPLKPSHGPTMHPHSQRDPNQMLMNVGLWGWGPKNYNDFVTKNRGLERRLQELDGMKWLYAHTYYNEADFWQSFDHEWYGKLRGKYGATSLPNVYEKVRIDIDAQRKADQRTGITKILAWWPFGGIYGIWKAIQSKSYIQARGSLWKTWVKRV